MRRDMDLLRQLLLELERHPGGFAPDEITIDGVTAEQIGYHAYLLHQAGLIVAADCTHLGSHSPQAKPLQLTWAGHEFLDQARPLDRWQQARTLIHRAGQGSLDVWKAVLTDLVKKSLGL